MKTILKCAFLLLCNCCLFFTTKAQDSTEQQQIDALHIKLMQDSLHISDVLAKQVLTIRDQHFKDVEQIVATTVLHSKEQERQLKERGKLTNEAIKTVLGDIAFKQYTDLIWRRMKTRKAIGITPLAIQ